MAQVASAVHRELRSGGETEHRCFVALPSERPVDGEVLIGQLARGAKSELARQPADIVHIHGVWTPFEWQVSRAAKAAGSKLVFSPHGSLEPWAFSSKSWKKNAAWWLYQKSHLASADLLIVNSEQERRQMRSLGLAGPIALIPNGIDLTDFPSDVSSAPIGLREKTVLFLGRIDPKKGILDLLRAWRSLANTGGYRLQIHGFGDPSYLSLVRHEIVALGLSDNVQLLPPLYGADKWRKYASSSLFVLPSYSENFGITVAEALYCGLPVITTEATPWADLAQRGLGWIIPNEQSALHNALVRAMSLSNLQRQDIARHARGYVVERYSWPTLVKRYRVTYSWLIEAKSSLPPWVERR